MTAPDFTARPLVYVAGPYTNPDPVDNTRKAIDWAEWLMEHHAVTAVVPHLSMLWHFYDPHPVDWWYAYDLALLARCDAVYRMAGASTGADAEVSFAVERGIPVMHDDLDLTAFLARWADL